MVKWENERPPDPRRLFEGWDAQLNAEACWRLRQRDRVKARRLRAVQEAAWVVFCSVLATCCYMAACFLLERG